MTNKIIIEVDDLNPHPEVDCLALAEKLVELYPALILNFFTTPAYRGCALSSNSEWCKRLRPLIDSGNVCLGVHGLNHSPVKEFAQLTFNEALYKLVRAATLFKEADLPFTKVFRGPHWGINQNTFEALIHLGYTHVYSHTDYAALNNQFKDRIKIVYYNWNGKDAFGVWENPVVDDIVVAHFHTSNVCGNGLPECFERLRHVLDNNDLSFLKINEI